MTPAINVLKKHKADHKIHRYFPQGSSESYGEEAAKALNIDASRVFKTLVVELNDDPKKLAVGVVPVNHQLDLKLIAKAAGAKKVQMANPVNAEKATGYVVGGISPLGQKKQLPIVLDSSIQNFSTVFFSAGKRGLQIELQPDMLIKLSKGKIADIAR